MIGWVFSYSRASSDGPSRKQLFLYKVILLYVHMAGIRVQLPEDLEKQFRSQAMKRFGYGKGSLSKAAQEAFERWISSGKVEGIEFRGNPVRAIGGLLKDVDMDSVELQHMAKRFWVKNVSH